MRAAPLFLGMLLLASSATAQERFTLTDFDLPREVERRLSIVVNNPDTRRINGSARIEPAETIAVNVVAYEGPLTVAGKIDGQLIVIGGDVEFVEGSSVTGDVTVVGGEARGLDFVNVGGTFTSYSEGFDLYHRGQRILSVNTRRRRWNPDGENLWGNSTFAVRTAFNYNRVEGLPILFGPVIQSGGHSPTRVEAMGILRTASGDLFDTERMGYQLRLEQFIGGRAFRVGASVRSVVEPVESWNLSNLEASLATFLLHDDQRDYFEREGWGAYVRWAPRSIPIDATVGYWDEDHSARVSRNPWTLFGGGAWRQQPLIGEGNLRSVSGRLQYDRRNDDHYPSSGLYFAAQATHGLSGSLAMPTLFALTGADGQVAEIPPIAINERFATGLADLRFYRRVGRDATLAFRAVGGGSIDGKSVPPQFQHALGGAGTMPGYDLFQADCGARRVPVSRDPESKQSFYPYYGCDRFALGSVEYRGGFDFDFGGDFDGWGRRDEDWNWHIDASPNWMVFFNAGHGWALGDSRVKAGATDTGVLYDAGAGIVLGGFGIYGAVPLNGENRSMNFFVRLGSRF
ncbi:MAG: hypothetical protein WEE89_09680 [Gemmatimonadota bacterium]